MARRKEGVRRRAFSLRLPEALARALEKAAAANNRSVNREVETAVEAWLGLRQSPEQGRPERKGGKG
jgi:hypothetical protein